MFRVSRRKIGIGEEIKKTVISPEQDVNRSHVLGMSYKRVCILREVAVVLSDTLDRKDDHICLLCSIRHQQRERTRCIPHPKRRRLSG